MKKKVNTVSKRLFNKALALIREAKYELCKKKSYETAAKLREFEVKYK
jgi:hypothetical protein